MGKAGAEKGWDGWMVIEEEIVEQCASNRYVVLGKRLFGWDGMAHFQGCNRTRTMC